MRCDQCIHASALDPMDAMSVTGFLNCARKPTWHYIAPARAACEEFKDKTSEQELEALAELFS